MNCQVQADAERERLARIVKLLAEDPKEVTRVVAFVQQILNLRVPSPRSYTPPEA
jgi:hypothetical protein